MVVLNVPTLTSCETLSGHKHAVVVHKWKYKCTENYVPVVIQFAVQLAIAHIARIVQRYTAHSARQALLVPAGVAHPHQIPVVDLLAAALAQFVVLLALDRAHL